jgi:hypothetical protein
MTTLIFFLTFLTLLVLLVSLIIKAIRRKPIKRTAKLIALIIGGYAGLWVIFYFISGYITVPLGTTTCFDDWCATITRVDRTSALPHGIPAPPTDSVWVILHVTMINQARGIAQKPSEPRIHLIDGRGGYWAVSEKGQKALEQAIGEQPGLDSKLELHQSLQTTLIFAVPANVKKVKALIEEGPFITKLLLPEDRQVYNVLP